MIQISYNQATFLARMTFFEKLQFLVPCLNCSILFPFIHICKIFSPFRIQKMYNRALIFEWLDKTLILQWNVSPVSSVVRALDF